MLMSCRNHPVGRLRPMPSASAPSSANYTSAANCTPFPALLLRTSAAWERWAASLPAATVVKEGGSFWK